VDDENLDAHFLFNLPFSNVPGYVRCNAKRPGLQHLQSTDVAASSLSPDRQSIVCHRMNELLVDQKNGPDVLATSRVNVEAK
jgi:hypothetical protein